MKEEEKGFTSLTNTVEGKYIYMISIQNVSSTIKLRSLGMELCVLSREFSYKYTLITCCVAECQPKYM